MSLEKRVESRRDKLGLALSGGGFRAALFHLGVLRRMAELDLLRYVEALSTVSGGSIIGALYILFLKKHLEHAPEGRLSREDYVEITKEVEAALVRGIQKNLRTRLFMNPLGVLRVLLTPQSLGMRMARLYERYFFRDVVRELYPRRGRGEWLRPGRILMTELRIRPGGNRVDSGIEAYNEKQVRSGGSALTHLIVNATSLNSGARFWFSHTEMGDWYLGHIRRSEIGRLLERKRLLQQVAPKELEKKLRSGAAAIRFQRGGPSYDRRTVALALWWRGLSAVAEGWEALFSVANFPGRLSKTAFGALRQAKIPAWYLRVGSRRETPVTGGMETDEHLALFWEALRRIDEELHDVIRPRAASDARFRDLLLDFVLELYWLRSAEVVSFGIGRDWARLTLGSAVGASACFPPVFPPIREPGFYDDLHVRLLALTDGGVYDNIGVTALGDEHCNYIVASDTSGPMSMDPAPSSGRLASSGRMISILMSVIAGLQREDLQEKRRMSGVFDSVTGAGGEPEPASFQALRRFMAPRRLEGLAFFHIHSPRLNPPEGEPAGLRLEVEAEQLARLRTDLDAFGDTEIDCLVNHGYDTADRYIRRYLAGSELFAPSRRYRSEPPRAPRPVAADPERARRIITVGRTRFFRALWLGAPVSWGLTLALVAAFVGAVWTTRVSLLDAGRALARHWALRLQDALWWLPHGWIEVTVPLGVVAAVLTVAGLSAAAGMYWPRSSGGSRRPRRLSRWGRPLAFGVKWLRLYAGNLLWLVKALPLLLAGGASLVAWASHLFFALPFLRSARRR